MNPIITKRCSPIEEAIYQDGFQAGAASRDAEVAKWKAAEHSLSDAYLRLRGLLDAFDTPRGVTAEQVWEHTEGKLIDLISERDQLRAQINVLRDAFQTFIDEHEECQDADEWMAELCSMEALHVAGEALATTPEQSLAEYRNKVIEDCAVLCEKSDRYRGAYFAEKLRAMKEQP